jgi:hypothetical protein
MFERLKEFISPRSSKNITVAHINFILRDIEALEKKLLHLRNLIKQDDSSEEKSEEIEAAFSAIRTEILWNWKLLEQIDSDPRAHARMVVHFTISINDVDYQKKYSQEGVALLRVQGNIGDYILNPKKKDPRRRSRNNSGEDLVEINIIPRIEGVLNAGTRYNKKIYSINLSKKKTDELIIVPFRDLAHGLIFQIGKTKDIIYAKDNFLPR